MVIGPGANDWLIEGVRGSWREIEHLLRAGRARKVAEWPQQAITAI
jgi:hypothetical protein